MKAIQKIAIFLAACTAITSLSILPKKTEALRLKATTAEKYYNNLYDPTSMASINITKGDVNSDGVVDSSDATQILIYYANTLLANAGSINSTVADVNSDGTVDSSDATIILICYAENLLGNNYSCDEIIQKINNGDYTTYTVNFPLSLILDEANIDKDRYSSVPAYSVVNLQCDNGTATLNTESMGRSFHIDNLQSITVTNAKKGPVTITGTIQSWSVTLYEVRPALVYILEEKNFSITKYVG